MRGGRADFCGSVSGFGKPVIGQGDLWKSPKLFRSTTNNKDAIRNQALKSTSHLKESLNGSIQ
jgi:hypothetical protein